MIDRDDAQVIPDYYAQNIENWITRNRGQLEMRDGITARGASPSATNLGATVLYLADGTKKLLRVIDGAGNTAKMQDSLDGTTWADVSGGGSLTTGRVWKFVQANNNIYGVNGSDTPIKYNGSAVSTVAAIPNGIAIEWWKNFLWVIGVAATPDRLYFSNAATPETFGGSDYVNINLGDASPGVGLKGATGISGRLYIGKARSVWYLTGTSSTDFAIQPLTYEHGVASHESMLVVKNDIWCIDLDGNVRSLFRNQSSDYPYSGNKSKDIQATISGLNQVSIAKSTAVYFDNYAMFFVPNGVDDYNSLVLVWDTLANEGKGGWIKFTNWNIARAVSFNTTVPKLFLFDSRASNGQCYEWTGTSDNGTAIVARYETKIYDHGYPNNIKRWKYAYQFAPATSGANLRFYTSIDRYYYTLLKTLSLAGAGDALWGVAQWGVDKWGSLGQIRGQINYAESGATNTGYTQQVKLEAESSSVKIKIRKFTSLYRVKGLR